MITIEENVSLLRHNTFAVDVRARYFCAVTSAEELQLLIAHPLYRKHRHLIIGAGSNILFTKDYSGLVIKMDIRSMNEIKESAGSVIIDAGAGEIWHDFVMHCVDHDYGGIENLSLIPGTCGAAPIQNIGAYGVEIGDRIEKVDAIDAQTGALRTFRKEECQFNYRESVFKHELLEKYFISSITLSLTKKNHFFNTQYGTLNETLIRRGVMTKEQLTVRAISDAVIEIREHKLPDVRVLGSAGSFFKNPTVTQNKFDELKNIYSSMPFYPSANQYVKIPAGWLIERCGWKGKRIGSVGVHQHQALVIVNYGGGSGEEIFQLAMNISSSVKEKFAIDLETEVNIV